jgi:hypothetical protein
MEKAVGAAVVRARRQGVGANLQTQLDKLVILLVK